MSDFFFFQNVPLILLKGCLVKKKYLRFLCGTFFNGKMYTLREKWVLTFKDIMMKFRKRGEGLKQALIHYLKLLKEKKDKKWVLVVRQREQKEWVSLSALFTQVFLSFPLWLEIPQVKLRPSKPLKVFPPIKPTSQTSSQHHPESSSSHNTSVNI